MKKLTILVILLTLCAGLVTAQSTMEKVFKLGEKEEWYEQLTSTYNETLLSACDNDIKMAFGKWMDMMQAMDAHADKVNFNLKGVQVWLHVFWNPEGSIDQLGFLMRPESRNVGEQELKAFFASFIKEYRLPLQNDRKFSHYTGATFPTISERVEN